MSPVPSSQDEPWTVRRVLEWTRSDLERAGDDHARLSAEWLVSAVTGKSRVELYLAYDEPLSAEELRAMHDAIVRRRAGEPLQYISGETAFRHIVVRCEPGVLIPRPETELLVEEVLTFLKARARSLEPSVLSDYRGRLGRWKEGRRQAERARLMGQLDADRLDRAALDGDLDEEGLREARARLAEQAGERDDDPGAAPRRPLAVLEVGCGTGCVALSIAHECDLAQVWATDISERACELARRNRDALGLTDAVEILHTDLDAAVPDELTGSFSVLVSNPPYVPTAVVDTLPGEVSDFEPRLALDGGEDGLDVFRRLLARGALELERGGLLAVELFEGHLDRAAELARGAGWQNVTIHRDLTDRPRILTCLRG